MWGEVAFGGEEVGGGCVEVRGNLKQLEGHVYSRDASDIGKTGGWPAAQGAASSLCGR